MLADCYLGISTAGFMVFWETPLFPVRESPKLGMDFSSSLILLPYLETILIAEHNWLGYVLL